MKTNMHEVYDQLVKVLTRPPRSSLRSEENIQIRVTKKSDRPLVTQFMHQHQKKGLWSDVTVRFFGDVFTMTRK